MYCVISIALAAGLCIGVVELPWPPPFPVCGALCHPGLSLIALWLLAGYPNLGARILMTKGMRMLHSIQDDSVGCASILPLMQEMVQHIQHSSHGIHVPLQGVQWPISGLFSPHGAYRFHTIHVTSSLVIVTVAWKHICCTQIVSLSRWLCVCV